MKKIILSFIIMLLPVCAYCQNDYSIYPVPHDQILTEEKVSFTKSVNLVCGKDIDAVTVERAKGILSENGFQVALATKVAKDRSNLILGINGDGGAAEKVIAKCHLQDDFFTKDKFDKHILHLYGDKAGVANVAILGEHTDAVFYGLASLEQILDSGTTGLNCVDILDYADMQHRGIIEGYYGVPYSAEVTKDIFRFMARYKMNTYMYGAKSDPYHSRFWSEPYPETITEGQKQIGYLSQSMLKEITDVAHATKVDFIWAIHPGTAFTDPRNPDVNKRIMDKFEDMHELGVRQFGVFVDDVGVPSDPEMLKLGADRLTELQNLIDARWNTDAVEQEDKVKPLHYVPQLYAFSWVSRDQAKAFFESLSTTPDKVNIYITGRNVWSVPNNVDLAIVKEYLGRPVSWWWNYPCNDNDMTKLFTMDIYSNFRDERHIDGLSRLETLNGTNTLIINPMQQGEISKITLFSVADYAWNNDAFNNDRSYQASIAAVVGEKNAEALRVLAPHLRYFDADALAYEVKNYKESAANGHARPGALIGKLGRIIKACEDIKAMEHSDNESDRLFYKDVRPWLLKLEAMAEESVSLLKNEHIESIDYDANPDFQFEVLNGMGEGITLSKLVAEPSEEILMPFIMWLRSN